jgi:hypothetical protein
LTGLIPRLREVVPLEEDGADAFGVEDDEGCPDGLELEEDGAPRALEALGRALEEPLRALVVPLELVGSLGFLAEDISLGLLNVTCCFFVALCGDCRSVEKSHFGTQPLPVPAVSWHRFPRNNTYLITYRHIIDMYPKNWYLPRDINESLFGKCWKGDKGILLVMW